MKTLFLVKKGSGLDYEVSNIEENLNKVLTLTYENRVIFQILEGGDLCDKKKLSNLILLKNFVEKDGQIIHYFKESYLNTFSKTNEKTLRYLRLFIEDISLNKFYNLVERQETIEKAAIALKKSENLTIDLCDFIIKEYKKTWF